MTEREDIPLIPREVLFGNPDKAMPRISPDGTCIAYLSPVDGVLNVWAGPSSDPSAAKPVTNDKVRGIRIFFWAYTSQHILYLQDKGGDENWRVYSVDLSTGQTVDLTPMEGVQARIQEVSPNFPEEIIVGLNNRDAQYHDLYRINITTGQKQLVIENTGFIGFLTDNDYDVRFAMRFNFDGGMELLTHADGDGWDHFMRVGMEDSLTTSPVGFDKSGRTLYMFDSRNRDTAALTSINLDTGQDTTLAGDRRADISDVVVHPVEKHVQAVAFTHQRKEWLILDNAIEPDLTYLRTVSDGDLEVVSRSLDDGVWIVAYLVDDGPVRYYQYHRERQRAEFLFTNRRALEGLPLVKMHPVSIWSRDGLELLSYYSLPAGSDGAGRPEMPLPMVLLVHGGPWGRDQWGYNPDHQMMANRGYVALSVNFRGSTGLGKGLINAANMEWGGKMHDDLMDAVQWAVEAGIADPQRIAITGGSYGGYATLVGLTFTPERFACGVAMVGPSGLVTLIESIPAYWRPAIDLWASRVGDPRTQEGRAFLEQRSPLSHVDRIKRPLLIGQGANDPRVKQTESDQIVGEMQRKNIPVAYLLYPDEGHGFARPENRLSFTAVAEAFLATHLGGRFQLVGEDFRGSSITSPAGADQVPGLADALRALAERN